MKVLPMTDEHVLAIRPQRHQASAEASVDDRLAVARGLRAAGSAYAVVDGGEVLLLAGVQTMWPGRGMAWALLAETSGRRLVRLTRLVHRYLDALDFRRLELYVDAHFVQGCRWAEVLGFKNETPEGMPGFLPGGSRAFMYGRVR